MAGAGWRQWTRERLSQTLLQTFIQDQVVQRWPSAAARSTGLTAPSQGMVSYRDDLDAMELRKAAGTWQRLQEATGWQTLGTAGAPNYDQAASAAWVDLPGLAGGVAVPADRTLEVRLQVPNLEAPVNGGVFIRILIGGTAVRTGRLSTNGTTALALPAFISGKKYHAAAENVYCTCQLFGAGGGGYVRGDQNTGPLAEYRLV